MALDAFFRKADSIDITISNNGRDRYAIQIGYAILTSDRIFGTHRYVIQINRNNGDYSVRRWYRTGRIGGALHSGKFTAKCTDFAVFDHTPGARLAMVMDVDKRRPDP